MQMRLEHMEAMLSMNLPNAWCAIDLVQNLTIALFLHWLGTVDRGVEHYTLIPEVHSVLSLQVDIAAPIYPDRTTHIDVLSSCYQDRWFSSS
ncbi:hypothetical protein Taro_042048 [Colocasia esculenta]|uniref:Uncharacterized protein n=1 Tax=Colocasia esculenta TaxID=4460 RepID=A0A843WVD7_COLES|nr:hypothetical protein [Colocasia esculenta]